MPVSRELDESLILRLPLPLAQLLRRANNALTPAERHNAAFYIGEAAIKLLASVCVVEYFPLGLNHPEVQERLKNLRRPALGHWWALARTLLPILAKTDASTFSPLHDFLFGRPHSDLPRTTGLDVALIEELDGKRVTRSAVAIEELVERLIRYRNKTIGHGAAGLRTDEYYDRMGTVLVRGIGEMLGAVDLLGGRALLYVAGVRKVTAGFSVQAFELRGEAARRLEPFVINSQGAATLPDEDRVVLSEGQAGSPAGFLPLHPLLRFEPASNSCWFLNSRHGKSQAKYLCYSSDEQERSCDLGGEQRALLAHALDLPLASEEEFNRRVERAAAEDLPAGADSAALPTRRFLGEYELLSELGRGGMGIVYRAVQPSIQRQVAVKRLFVPGDPKAEGRFRREIQALGRVEHPNLVKIYTSGCDGDQWYYVMELIAGVPLSVVCQKLADSTKRVADVDVTSWQAALSTVHEEARGNETKLSRDHVPALPPAEVPKAGGQPSPAVAGNLGYIRQVVDLMIQTAEAAAALHQQGILHRDIKPSNILLDAAGRHATLMDLGLAKFLDRTDDALTRTRGFVGTVRYASPEQVLALGDLDARSDIYSLGATLWELLTLRPLYGAEQLTERRLMRLIVYKPVERVRRHNPNIPPDLDAIAARAMERDPDDRYADATDLARDLRNWLEGKPLVVPRRPVGRQVFRLLKRNPLKAVAASMLVIGVIVALMFINQPTGNPPVDATVKELTKNPGPDVQQVKSNPYGQLAAGIVPKKSNSLTDYHELFVLSVGVSDYKNMRGGSLPYAAQDADDLAKAFRSLVGAPWSKVSTKVLKNEDATRGEILLTGLRSWLMEQQMPTTHSLVIVTFSGHGFAEYGTNRFHFAAQDYDPMDQSTGIFFSDLQRYLDQLQCTVVLVFDTCDIGGTVNWTDDTDPNSPQNLLKMIQKFETESGAKNGLVIMVNCGSYPKANETHRWGHGALALALLEGIQGKYHYQTKELDQTPLPTPVTAGMITLQVLDRYVTDRVERLSSEISTPKYRSQAAKSFATGNILLDQIPITVRKKE